MRTFVMYNEGTLEIYELSATGQALVAHIDAPGLSPAEIPQAASALLDLYDVLNRSRGEHEPRAKRNPRAIGTAYEQPSDPRLRVPVPKPYQFVRYSGVKIGRVSAILLNVIRAHPEGIMGKELWPLAGFPKRDQGAASSLTKLRAKGFVHREGINAGSVWFPIMPKGYVALEDNAQEDEDAEPLPFIAESNG
jgi:hypothetical protein